MPARLLLVPLLLGFALAPSAFGQIIYENVRYQHVAPTGQRYYYGGVAPEAFDFAQRRAAFDAGCYTRHRLGAFSGGDRCGELFNPYPPIYSDLLPYYNVRRYGFTADDARNHAVRTAPRYFRKADLLRAAEVQPDGSLLVPARPRMLIVIDRSARRAADADAGTTRPATTGKILIIPKPRRSDTSDKPMLASR